MSAPSPASSSGSAGLGTAALEAMHEEEALGKAYDARLLRRLWPYVRPYWKQVVLTIVLVGPIFLLEIAPAWIIKTGLDRVLVPKATGTPALSFILDPPGSVAPFLWLGLLYLGVMICLGALQFGHLVLMARTGQSAMRDLRSDVFDHIQRLHLGFFDRYPVGRLVTRATNDVENVAEMFSAGIVALITDVLRMIGFAVVLFLVDARLALVTFLVVPFLAGAAIVFRFKVRAAFRLIRVRIARINTYIQETITGMKVVQLFIRERRNQATFEHLNADHRDAWFTSIRWDAALFSVVEIAGGVTVAIIIWYGTGSATAGTLFVFIDWMRRFFMPLRDLSAKYSVMQSSMASCERIFVLLDAEPAIRDAERPALRPSAGARGAVEFQDVWFAYQGEDWVLRGLSFRVEPGERVALVGGTGAGKTTIIQLLTRLYEVQRGRILLDGVDLRELPQGELRRRVAMVLQDVFLFSGTLEENIGLGRAAEVRERGSNFSTGQRQLLSFARALVHGADVLVLDEATSSIDTETETLLQHGIHVLMEGKTAIVIAHRLSTIEDVDRIYVVEQGRLVESGSHRELLAASGLYARLHRLQYQAPAVDAATSTEGAPLG
jgi:ATP-binding cassette subfamily B protein